MKVRVRLAPSPTGTLHIGTARTALFNWLYARHLGGDFLVRIEDTDKERSKSEYTKNILEGLNWLGINWDEPPVLQSKNLSAHQDNIKILLDQGLAYRCFATEEELEEMRAAQKSQGKPPRYDNRHRDLSQNEQEAFKQKGRTAVVRFRIDNEAFIEWDDLIRGPMSWKGEDLGGDMVISRRAPAEEIGEPLYNLAVVSDDSAMGITHVIRGEDHIANTAKQILLYKAMKLNIPKFAHTPLILNKEGRKLSKRDGVTSINDFQELGYTSEALVNYMALLGWSVPEGMEERFTLQEAAKAFSFERVNKAGAKFDWDKLNWLNAQVIHGWSNEVLLKNLSPLWVQSGWQLPPKDWCIKLVELLRPSLILIKDGLNQASPFFEEPTLQEDGNKQLQQEGAKESIKELLIQLDKTPWDGIQSNQAKEILAITANSAGIKKGLLMKSLRAALLGTMNGPDLITTWGLLARIGKDRKRLISRV